MHSLIILHADNRACKQNRRTSEESNKIEILAFQETPSNKQVQTIAKQNYS